eukprot:TRINITY_DN4124_c0_g2_i1.p1 TRINITY_DN4124_c0_g2~~TRINITY_DN4124_c0_g2_i1.p1  ORF type:complete len:731 (-),score=231.50 TRINITY_DN4124_c0_g2_i1:489-2681(-)
MSFPGADPREWSAPEVGMWLERENMSHLNSKFLNNDISGLQLLKMNEHDMLAIGIFLRKDVDQLMNSISELRQRTSCSVCHQPMVVENGNTSSKEVCKCEHPSENSQSHSNTNYCPKIDQDGTNFNPLLDNPQQLEFWNQKIDNSQTVVKFYFGQKIELSIMDTDKLSIQSMKEKAMDLFDLQEMKLKMKDKEKGDLVYLDEDDQLNKMKEMGGTLRVFVEQNQHDLLSFISLLYHLVHPAIVIQGHSICSFNRATDRELRFSTLSAIGRPVDQLVVNYTSKCVGQVCPLTFKAADGTLTSYLCSVSQLLPNTFLLLVLQTDNPTTDFDQLSSASSSPCNTSYSSSDGASFRKLTMFQKKSKRRDDDNSSAREMSGSNTSTPRNSPPQSRMSSVTPLVLNDIQIVGSAPLTGIPEIASPGSLSTSPQTSSPLALDEEKDISCVDGGVQPPELNKSLLQALETVLVQPKSADHTVKFLAAFRLYVPASHLIFYLENICNHFSKPSYAPISKTFNTNVVSFIKNWVDNFPKDFASRLIKQNVLNIIQRSGAEGNNEVKLKLLKLHHQKNASQTPHLGFTTQSALDMEVDKLVMALTCYDWSIWSNVKPEEFSEGNWQCAQKETKAPHLHLLATRFDQLSFWTAEKILMAKSMEDRVSVMEKFIDIAYGLYKIYNFHTMMSIFLGLNLAAISRLRLTWEKVSSHHRSQFKALEELMAPLRNYAPKKSMTEMPS